MGQHSTKKSLHPSLLTSELSSDLRTRAASLYSDLRNEVKHAFSTSFKKRALKLLADDGTYYVSELKKLPFVQEALSHIPDEDLKLLSQEHVKALITSLYNCLDSELDKVLDHLYPPSTSQQPVQPSPASVPPQQTAQECVVNVPVQ